MSHVLLDSFVAMEVVLPLVIVVQMLIALMVKFVFQACVRLVLQIVNVTLEKYAVLELVLLVIVVLILIALVDWLVFLTCVRVAQLLYNAQLIKFVVYNQ